MNTPNKKVLIIVGSDGMIASRLLSSKTLYDMYNAVYGISRNKTYQTRDNLYEHIVGDASDTRLLKAIISSEPPTTHIDVINLAIDKSSLRNMVDSLNSIDDAITLAASGHRNVNVLLLSTSAVLAPFFLRTTYANAKLNELRKFIDTTDKLNVFLCPQVIESSSQKVGTHRCDKYFITLDNLVQCILQIVSRNTEKGLYVPDKHELGFVLKSVRDKRPTTLLKAAYQWVKDPENRHYSEREITYSILSFLSPRMRQKLDHHALPENRINTFCSKLKLRKFILTIRAGA